MNIVEVLLKELKVNHSHKFIEDNYLNAPDSDNMLGIQRILSRYGIESVGVHFKNKEEAGITFPCVLHWGNYAVVGVDIDRDEIKYYFSLSRAIRLSMDYSPQGEFATNFIAPIIVPYVYYVLEDARRRDINKLFFIARDGYILYLIAQVFAPLFPGIGLHYLYASRKSLYLPGLEELNYRSIKDIVPLDKGIKGILYSLNIQDFDYSHLDFKGLDTENILAKCCEDPLFIDAVKKAHQEQETLCIKYLKQEGFFFRILPDLLFARANAYESLIAET